MNKVRITAIRQSIYHDCPSAWSSMREFVESLARGEGNFYDLFSIPAADPDVFYLAYVFGVDTHPAG